MRTRLVSILAVLIMALVLIPWAYSTNSNANESVSDPLVNCSQVRIDRDTVRINCSIAGVAALPIFVQLPTVPPVTVNVPVPGTTTTIHVGIPGPTKTVTAHETITVPGPTKTVTVRPTPNSPSAVPTSRQTVTESATVVTTVTAEPSTTPQPDTPSKVVKIVKKAALGLVSIIALVAIVLLGMYLGYYIGYKDSDQANARFMRALRDSLIISRKH